MMKRGFLIPSLFLAFSFCAAALDPGVRDVSINVALEEDGSATITEIWDVCAVGITEWYLVKENLGDIEIENFRVRDENGTLFTDEGSWDVDRSISRKAFRSGIVSKRGGYELCWGVGSEGDHVFTASYRMTNVVKTLTDADALHMQFVSPGLSSAPEHVRVKISGPGVEFSESVCGIWAFGYNGTIEFRDGAIVAESAEPFVRMSSVIVLARFQKGIFNSPSVQDTDFESIKKRAFEGSAYQDYLDEEAEERRNAIGTGIFFLLLGFLSVFAAKRAAKKTRRRIFGVSDLKDIGYERDLPFGGDLLMSNSVLVKTQTALPAGNVASAMILRMIKNNQIFFSKDAKGNTLLTFGETADLSALSGVERELYDMVKEASGSDKILQKKEFSHWSRRHSGQVAAWATAVKTEGESRLRSGGYYLNSLELTEDGKANARKVIGLMNYLKDFTLLKERGSAEVALWHDYIVFAALYGIADKVAKELQEINPQAFREVVGYDYPTMNSVIILSNNMSSALTEGIKYSQTRTSVRGGGGFSSFGGGGGFSGGGFGGGGR